MEISANDVKTLRDRTGVQMMKCKAALQEANGDMEKAIELIRKQNKDASVKLGSRETAEGRIATYIDPVGKVGAIVEVRCESAPVAKTDLFVKLAEDLAKQVALKSPTNPEEILTQPFVDKPSQTVSDRMSEVVGLVRENMKVARMKRLTGLLGHYIHHDGSVGVLVQVHGDKADDQLLRDISMHITAKNPTAALREHIAEDRIAKEKEIALAQMEADPKTKGKPAAILDKIIEGKLKTWFAENVLVEQPFVKDDSKTVGELLKASGLTMVNFVRYRVGEVS
jgi:elongation factor Ts